VTAIPADADTVAGAAPTTTLAAALETIAEAAAENDRAATFPQAALRALRDCGALAWGARPGAARPPAADELALVRRVAAADGSVGRIFDGHVNAVERIAVHAIAPLRDELLLAVRDDGLRLGVWGADPGPGEGPPATLGSATLRGVKTFCSGAGGLDVALVNARDPDGEAPWLVVVDLRDPRRVEIDPTWFRAGGLRASVSHRVVFHDAPVLGVLGHGVLTAGPWFARDALRTAATWAGMADTAADAALVALAARPQPTDLEALAAGRIAGARATIDAWIAEAATAMDAPGPHIDDVAIHARAAIATAARVVLEEALRALGARALVAGGTLDRARRDVELLLLQHRLDPLVARAGARELEARR
jgi:alkylation response protein AidB-like acyl-CoA dehydrogenase